MINIAVRLIVLILFSFLVWFIFEFDQKIHFELQDYDIEISLFFLILLTMIMFVIFRILEIIIKSPFKLFKKLRYKSEILDLRKALLAYENFIIGNINKGKKISYKIRNSKYLPSNFITLSNMIAAKNEQNDQEFIKHANKLLENEDTKFLSLKELSKYWKLKNDYVKAIDFAKQARNIHRNDKPLNEHLYELYHLINDFMNAMNILKTLHKNKHIDNETFTSGMCNTIFNLAKQEYCSGEITKSIKNLEKIYKIDPLFIDAGVMLSKLFIEQKLPKKAEKVIQKYWSKSPDSRLAKLMKEIFENKSSDFKVKKLQSLKHHNINSTDSDQIINHLIREEKLIKKPTNT